MLLALTSVALVPAFAACSAMAFLAQARGRPSLEAWNLASALTSTALSLSFALDGNEQPAVVVGVLAVLRWRIWRRGPRGKLRRALRALGAKARAKLAAMARNMPKPGLVLQPVPQRAGGFG